MSTEPQDKPIKIKSALQKLAELDSQKKSLLEEVQMQLLETIDTLSEQYSQYKDATNGDNLFASRDFEKRFAKMGLQSGSPATKTRRAKGKHDGKGYREGTVKFNVLELMKDGKVRGKKDIAKETKLNADKLSTPIFQMVSKDKTLKSVGRGSYQVNK